MKIVITGNKGFIGSHLTKMICENYPESVIYGLDAGTYAARPPVYKKKPANLVRLKINIQDQLAVRKVLQKIQPDQIYHLAAESHVCRSITGPKDFVMTNILGTWNLLEEYRDVQQATGKQGTFLYVSTDEVFGEISKGKFTESSPIEPRSPYATAKAGGDLLVQSYHTTYGLDTRIVNPSNNFGPNQHDEKLVPKTIIRLLKNQPVDIYQDGKQIRDWLFVEDCARGLITIMNKGKSGHRYLLGGDNEKTNLEMVKAIADIVQYMKPEVLVKLRFLKDARPTDDLRYALDIQKVKALGWEPNKNNFKTNLHYTVMWYFEKLLTEGQLAAQGRV